MPSRPPARERDLENVWVTMRLSYFLISGTAEIPEKSAYASSMTTMLSGLDAAMRSISQSGRTRPVGAFGFAMKMVLPIPM